MISRALLPGDRVSHKTFGQGTVVVATDTGTITVDFDGIGEKRISAQPPYDRMIAEINGQSYTSPYTQQASPVAKPTDPYLVRQPTASPVAVRPRQSAAPPGNGASARARQVVNRSRQGHGPYVWWVNQGATYQQERDGGYLWAPLKDKVGRSQWHWETMAEIRLGDVIVHYGDGYVRALGRSEGEAHLGRRPVEFEESAWESEGRRVSVTYAELHPPIPLRSIADKLLALSVERGPINRKAEVKQAYLVQFSLAGLRIIRTASSAPWPDWVEALL